MLGFQTERSIRHSVRGAARPQRFAYIKQIGGEGETPFEGNIRFEMWGAHRDTYIETPSGHVWLAPGDHGPKSDTLFLVLNLTEGHVASIYQELVARPQSMLTLRLNFAYFQHERGGGLIALERNAQVPILEASVSVMDRPLDWVEDEGAKEAVDQSPLAPPIFVQPNLTPLVTRLNWTIGLLALFALIVLFK